MATLSNDMTTDIQAKNMNGRNEFVSDCLQSEDLTSLHNIFSTLNDCTDGSDNEMNGDNCADMSSVVDDNVRNDDTTTEDVVSDGISHDSKTSNKTEAQDAGTDFMELTENADADENGGQEMASEEIPSDDMKDLAKEQMLTILDLGEVEEPNTDLGADYGVAIQLPEDEVESVKEENCCHGFKLVVGAVVIYSAIAFYQILANDISDKLAEEYAKEVLADFIRQNQPTIPNNYWDFDRTTMARSFYEDNSSNNIYSHDTSTTSQPFLHTSRVLPILSPTTTATSHPVSMAILPTLHPPKATSSHQSSSSKSQSLYGEFSTASQTWIHSTSGLPRTIPSTPLSSDSPSSIPTSDPKALSRRKRQTVTFDMVTFQKNLDDIAKINDVYNKTRGLMGLVSAILVVLLNYRIVILIASSINLTSLLIAMFVRNFKVLIFLMGFCTGVGNNMLFVAMTVAILETFRKYRTMASTISGAMLAIGYTAIMLLKGFVFEDVGMTTSKSYIGLLTAIYGLCILAAFLVQPLNLKMKDSADTFIARALNISGLRLFKAWGIYVLAGVFFFYTYSIETPLSNIDAFVDSDEKPFVELTVRSGSLVSVTLIFIFMGGCCFCCRRCDCCTRKECCCRRCVNGCFRSIPINRLLIVLAISCTVASLNCLFVVGLGHHMAYVFAYSTVLGLATGLADPLLIVAIPALLGEEFMSLGVGVTDFAKGLASVIAGEMAEFLLKQSKPRVIFYMGIGTFLIGGVLATLLNRLHRSGLVVPLDSGEDDGDARGTQDDEGVNHEVKGHHEHIGLNDLGGDVAPEPCFVVSKEKQQHVDTTQSSRSRPTQPT